MSGVTGNNPIKGRNIFKKIYDDYTSNLLKIPEVKNVQISGSYVSNANKKEFGDMDLILTVNTNLDKKEFKKKLAKTLVNLKGTKPFVSPKYKGRKFYNSGEIITVSYKSKDIEPCQIDNIIALSNDEAKFKLNFLNMSAEKQGLLLGLMKVVFIENWKTPIPSPKDTEYEYNLSSKELSLRLVKYKPGTLKEIKREIIWTSTKWEDVLSLVPFDLNKTFAELVSDCKTLKPRSKNRIKGIFKSMVSVKSGEVGKPKGQRKEYCITQIEKL